MMSDPDKVLYPFADIDLARRLEKTEAQGNRDFIDARASVSPQRGAAWINVDGTSAMFDGPDSPLTQTFGLGVFNPLTEKALDKIENFFFEKNADVFHEVCPLADASTLTLLNDRDYRPIEFSNVLYRPITPDFRLKVSLNDRIQVKPIEPDEKELWAKTAFEGWIEYAELADFLRELGGLQAHSKSISFLAKLNGKAIAAGGLIIADDVALLAGASTVPNARRQGAQLALLEARLRHAAKLGCTVGMMVALPGSGSQRNAERHGFRIAYTRTKWHRKQ